MAASKKVKVTGDTSLADLLGVLNGKHGEGTVMVLGETELPEVAVIPSGSIRLDEAMVVGGFARGRIVEIFGPESSGKTSLALHAMGNAQRQGLNAAFIDAEHALDPEWAETLGVDTDRLIVSQPDSGEQALQVVEALTVSRKVGIITVDSVAALVPRAELEGEIGDTHVALQARMMSQALRKLSTQAHDSGTTIIFINQLREKVGVFFGNAETRPGGKALKFYASVILDVRRIQTLKDGDQPVGSRVRVKVVKNKLGRPFQLAEFDFLFGTGVSRPAELIDLGVERGLLKKSGAFYTCPETGATLGQGKGSARRYLDENPAFALALEDRIRKADPVPVRLTGKADKTLEMEGPAPWEDGSEAGD